MSVPCMPYPNDASFKTIGLAPCDRCGSDECWLHYLRWEVRVGITLNEQQHHLVKEKT